MNQLHLTRTFLKKPLYSISLFVALLVLVEGMAWTATYSTKLAIVSRYGGFFPYLGVLCRNYILPEICTAYILVTLLNQYHTRLHIHTVKLTTRDVAIYELSLLPVILVAFFVFNPVTQTVRFVFEQFADYKITKYWHEYLVANYSWDMYFRYLVPVFILGYVIVNISLISDYFAQRQKAQDLAEAEAAQTMQQALALSATFTPKPTVPSIYLSYLKGKNNVGELDFPVNTVYYFTTEDRANIAVSAKGSFTVGKTINELESELDSTQFFRIKRDYIVNRQAVLNYAYWENGKYIVRLNDPSAHNIIVPRARMHEFREWLQNADANPLELTS